MEMQIALAGTVTTGDFALNRAKLDVQKKREIVRDLRAKLDKLKAKLTAESKKAGIKIPRLGQDTERHHRVKAIRNKEYQALSDQHMKAVEVLREARDAVKKLKGPRKPMVSARERLAAYKAKHKPKGE